MIDHEENVTWPRLFVCSMMILSMDTRSKRPAGMRFMWPARRMPFRGCFEFKRWQDQTLDQRKSLPNLEEIVNRGPSDSARACKDTDASNKGGTE
jgi:hypothetical protein